MNRLLSRVGVRVTSVGLLLTGVAGGVYLGQSKQVQAQSNEARLVVQADAAEVDLLKDRHAAHAAARAPQRKAEAMAAEKAGTEAKAAADRAHKLEKAALAKKAADKKAADEKAAEEKAEQAEARADAESADDSGDESGDDSGPSTSSAGPIPASCNEYSGNRAIGCAVVLDAGLSMKQMACLDKLFKKESGWNPRARNRGSGAYGIPQALPGSKMASAGPDWKTNPRTQVKWGLGYISGRYGTPCGAWSHSQNKGWY